MSAARSNRPDSIRFILAYWRGFLYYRRHFALVCAGTNRTRRRDTVARFVPSSRHYPYVMGEIDTGSAFRLALPAVVKAAESRASAPKPTPSTSSTSWIRGPSVTPRLRLAHFGKRVSGSAMLTATVAGPGSTYRSQNVTKGPS